jgi:uncharacterized protein YegL
MWATRRRIQTIGLIVATIVVFIVFPYWVTHRVAPTCTDAKQNQKEMGVDCGGPCTLRCVGTYKELNILWTKVFQIRPSYYDVVSYVENANSYAGITRFSYTAKLFDEGGREIGRSVQEAYARPNERFVLFAGGIDTGGAVARSGSIELPAGMRWESMLPSDTLFSVKEKILSNLERKPELNALLQNDTPDLYRNIDVISIIYDDKNNPIGVSRTSVEKLDAKGTAKLIFTWPAPFDYEAGAEQCVTPVDVILALDRSGSMNIEGKIEQAKLAAEGFVDRLTSKDQGGYVTFSSVASTPIDQTLTSEVVRLKRAISTSGIQKDGTQFTNIGDALRRAIDEFATQRRNRSARPIIVLLTDGIPNRPLDENGKGTEAYGSKYALQIADEAKRNGITLYAIGLGSDVNTKLLEQIATAPDYYYAAASGSELGGIYQQIATAMCKKAPSVIEVIPRVNNAVPTLQTP